MGVLDGKAALVTGGSRGIGAAVARRLAADGAAVAINYRSGADAAQALVAELTEAGHRAVALQADVADPQAVAELTRQAAEDLGGLDILVSNAGVEHFGPLQSITPADFQRVFGINVAGQLFAAQAAAARMPPGGRIVLMSSVSVRLPVRHHCLYAASKAAITAMVLNLAPELAERGIAINAIAPGGTRTDMSAEVGRHYVHPELADLPEEKLVKIGNAWGRFAEPDEIAACIAFLVSPDAGFLTGSTLAADGSWR